MKAWTAGALVTVLAAVGCGASIPPPNNQWAAAQVDVGRAQAGGAPNNPDARLHLQLAQEDLQKSKQLIGNDNERATTLTELGRTEAQLALSLAKSAAAQDDARKASADLQAGPLAAEQVATPPAPQTGPTRAGQIAPLPAGTNK